MPLTRFTLATISCIVAPASCTSLAPSPTFSTESPISALISLAACGRALGQVAHFVRHHREAPALLARARRLDRRVQRQDIGLEGDAVDDADDVDDLAGRVLDRVHGVDHARHHLAAAAAPRRRPIRPARWPGARSRRSASRSLVSSSIEAAVSSSELACSSVRLDRSRLPLAISLEAVAIGRCRCAPGSRCRPARRAWPSWPPSGWRWSPARTAHLDAEVAAGDAARHLDRIARVAAERTLDVADQEHDHGAQQPRRSRASQSADSPAHGGRPGRGRRCRGRS